VDKIIKIDHFIFIEIDKIEVVEKISEI